MTDPYLLTPRLRLRQYVSTDFAHLLELYGDPEVMRYVTRVGADIQAEAQFTAERALHYQQRYDGQLGLFIAELIADSAFVGWFLLRPDKSDLDDRSVLELGYRLKKAFWRKGYATEVSERLIAKAFGELGAENIFADAMTENAASRRVMEKIGMRYEREFIPDAPASPTRWVAYRIHQADWEHRTEGA